MSDAFKKDCERGWCFAGGAGACAWAEHGLKFGVAAGVGCFVIFLGVGALHRLLERGLTALRRKAGL